jgi:hypothetical protein
MTGVPCFVTTTVGEQQRRRKLECGRSICGGAYREKLVRTAQGWRFAEITSEPLFRR